MSDYVRRVFRGIGKLFGSSTDKEQKENPPLKPPQYFTPLRPSSRCDFRVQRPPRHLSIPAGGAKIATSCPIMQCPSQLSVKRFNSDGDLSIKSEQTGSILIKPKPCELLFVEENASRIPKRVYGSEISQPPSYKSSESSFADYFSVVGDPATKKMFPATTRGQCGRSKQILHQGCLHSCENQRSSDSRIPVSRNLSQRRQRGLHTLPTQQKTTLGAEVDRSQHQAERDSASYIMSSDIGNWLEFRNDTTARFEMVFKAISKKKFPIGNLIDSSSHARWMQLSGIGVERDAKIFKHFAGGKVVLNIGEYKYLLDRICRTHDLDYWDVMRKMAMVYQIEDPQH